MLIDNEIINDLFKIISDNTKIIDNKDIIKELLILLDSFGEILFTTEKNRENKEGIELFLNNCVKFINERIKDYSNDNQFVLIINTFYTMMKMKLELGNDYEDLFNNNKIYDELNKNIIIEALDENMQKNEKYDIKENINLINALFCFFLIEFFNSKNEKENLIHINELIKSFSVLLNQKKKEQKTEIYQDENLDLFKAKYNTISTLMKLFSLFDIKRSNFYSLNIKVTKTFEDYMKSIEQILLQNNVIIYMTMILNLLQQYIYNMDLFYELDNTMYEKIFNLTQNLIETTPFNDIENNPSIYEEKNKFIQNLKFNELSLNSDDSISKYQMLLFKLFKFYDAHNNKGEYNSVYIKYFQKVLNITFYITQHYLKEKYISLLQRELKTKIDNCENIQKIIFEEILEKISKIIETKNITLIKNYKNLSKFYSSFEKLIEEIISYIKINYSENKEKIGENEEIKIILLISILGNNNKMLQKFIEEVPCNIILFINQKMANFTMINYIEEETQRCINQEKLMEVNINKVIKVHLKEQKNQFLTSLNGKRKLIKFKRINSVNFKRKTLQNSLKIKENKLKNIPFLKRVSADISLTEKEKNKNTNPIFSKIDNALINLDKINALLIIEYTKKLKQHMKKEIQKMDETIKKYNEYIKIKNEYNIIYDSIEDKNEKDAKDLQEQIDSINNEWEEFN